jgi:hypothetical protein
MTPAVQEMAVAVWDARARRELLRDARGLARGLARCVAQDVAGCEDYDPELDSRVMWLRELIADLRHCPGWREPRAAVNTEYQAMLVLARLEPCGKVRAAGAA